MIQLFDHQQKVIDEDPLKCGLWFSTGAGKTRIALLLARGKTLVIAPKTQVLDQNWQREKDKLGLDIDLTVISKEAFRRDWETLPRFDTVIGEEAHTLLGVTPNIRYKNKQAIPKTSQIFEAFYSFIQKTKPERLYLCTATIVKSPLTVFAAGVILEKWQLASFYNFRAKYYQKLPMPGREVYAPKSDKQTKDDLALLVKKLGYIGRLEQFFDVPLQTYRTIHIELTKKQKDRIKELPFEFPDPLVLIGKKNQIENGILSGDEFSAPEIFENGKIDVILDLMVEFPQMLIAVKYSAQIAQIATAIKKAGRKVLILEGATIDRRQVILEANTSPEYVFIAQASMGAGWEVPNCPVIIFASRTYSYTDYSQFLGRIQRVNNLKKNLFIHLIVKGGTDEAIDKCLANKQDFNERLYLNI